MVSFVTKCVAVAAVVMSATSTSARPLEDLPSFPCAHEGNSFAGLCDQIPYVPSEFSEGESSVSKMLDEPLPSLKAKDGVFVDEDKWCPENRRFGCSCDRK
jgi:hypothetical protein